MIFKREHIFYWFKSRIGNSSSPWHPLGRRPFLVCHAGVLSLWSVCPSVDPSQFLFSEQSPALASLSHPSSVKIQQNDGILFSSIYNPSTSLMLLLIPQIIFYLFSVYHLMLHPCGFIGFFFIIWSDPVALVLYEGLLPHPSLHYLCLTCCHPLGVPSVQLLTQLSHPWPTFTLSSLSSASSSAIWPTPDTTFRSTLALLGASALVLLRGISPSSPVLALKINYKKAWNKSISCKALTSYFCDHCCVLDMTVNFHLKLVSLVCSDYWLDLDVSVTFHLRLVSSACSLWFSVNILSSVTLACFWRALTWSYILWFSCWYPAIRLSCSRRSCFRFSICSELIPPEAPFRICFLSSSLSPGTCTENVFL